MLDASGHFPYKGFIDCLAKSVKNEGVIGLWVGLSAFYMRIAPHAMISVLCQDYFHDLISSFQKNQKKA
jgi:solute carrier family 25 oxoglutarate transporter 11